MKKILFIILTTLMFISCGSKETTKPTTDKASIEATKKAEAEKKAEIEKKQKEEALLAAKLAEQQKWVTESNSKLEKIPVTGFAYRKTELEKPNLDKWLKDNLAIIKDIVKNMPEGYILEIKGHASAFDPKIKLPKGEKPISLEEISEKRAKFIYDALISNGIEKEKLTFKGVAEKEPLNKENLMAAENRRVTFSVVKK